MEHIGERIRIRRKMLNMSQADLAEKVGYDTDNNKSTISKIETGVNDITRTKITIFAKALDTTEAFLMGWTDNPESTHDEVVMQMENKQFAPQKVAAYNNEEIEFTEFDYAMHGETKNMTEEQKAAIMQMAQMLNATNKEEG